MATKTKTAAKSTKSAPKAAKAPKAASAAKAAAKPRHPMARLKAAFESKEALVGKLVGPLSAAGDDADALRARLLKASNQQLLRLAATAETVKSKFGSRDKLIAAIGSSMNKAKDKDYLAKLATFSLPRLLDMATSAARRK